MTTLTVPVLGLLLHAVHYTLIVGGALAVGALVLAATRPQVAEGALVAVRAATTGAGGLLVVPSTAVRRSVTASSTAVPVAVVASAAAAGVHAVATPAHLEEGWLVGSFFVGSALVQLCWALTVLLRGASEQLLALGLSLNASIVALWVLTRTTGLPGGLAPVERVGGWDLAATSWEVAVVGACVVALHRGVTAAGHRHAPWSTAARCWLAVSVLVLAVLATTGTPS